MKVSRALLGVVGVLLAGSAIGHRSAAAAAASPSVSIRRVTSIMGRTVAGDFNGDGFVDLAAAATGTPFPRPLAVALGRGDGTFGAPVSMGVNGAALAAGDFNKDGKLDLIADLDTGDMPLNFMPGRGDGTFGPPAQIGGAVAVGLTFAAVADIDGDGNLDLAIGFLSETDNDAVLVYAGHGDGTFSDVMVALHTGSLSHPHGAAIADVNGDGKPDIVVANHDAHTVSVFLNQGAFTFTAADIPLDRQANDVAIADVNRDGKPDLLVATSHDGSDDLFYIDGFVYVLRGNGDGTFGAPAQYATEPGAWQIAMGDFNRDGVPDVATVNYSAKQDVDACGFLWDSVSILPGNTDGTFGAASSFSLGNQSNLTDFHYRDTAASIVAVDVNRDGWKDLVASAGAVLLNQAPDPNWPPTVTASATQPNADHSIALSAVANDVDQDRLSYAWTESGGQPIEPTATPCRFTPATGGAHTFTVTVDDHHGHTATSSVMVDFGTIGGGSTPGTVSINAPAQGETVQGGTPYTVRWTASGDLSSVTHWSLAFTTDGTGFSPIAECSNVPADARECTWDNPNPPTPGAQIIVTNGSETSEVSGISGVFAIAGPSGGVIGDGWAHADVGAVGAAGSATFDGFLREGAAFTVSASGADIWGTADEFHHVWKKVNGDFQINTRVDSVENVNAWTKAGIMLRADATDPSSPHATIVVSPSKGIAFQRRTSEAGATVSTQGPALAAPVWLRMVRMGNTVKTYYRKNLTDLWTLAGQQTFTNMPALANIGIAVASHADGTLATAKFSGVRFGGLPLLFGHAIGSATGSATTDGTTYTVTGSGSDIWGTSDNFFYVATVLNAAEVITARVRTLGNTDAWAKAGVMIRESLDANSKHADAIVSPSKGIAFQYRAATGGASASAAQFSGSAPIWLRVRRFESASSPDAGDILAWWSSDGNIWHPFCCRAPVATAHDAFVGLAVTSHHAGVETTAVIDDVWIER